MRTTKIPNPNATEIMEHQIYCGDFRDILYALGSFDCVFADPPDNLGLAYGEYKDKIDEHEYRVLLANMVSMSTQVAPICWFSFYAKHVAYMGSIIHEYTRHRMQWEFKPCVQTFTFGQHNNNDLGNNHRPLWRLRRKDAPLYPEQTKVPSWRQLNGDKRAKEGGRVPGDVFDFPRVTGNSKQRRAWHPTQLHEGLVERCLLLSTKPGDRVLDICGGTGTTLRVCKRIGRHCTLIDVDQDYCQRVAEEHGLTVTQLRDVA